MPREDREVAILMGTKNGVAFIDAQLQSIANQTHENWKLIVSDDGSTDETILKVEQFAASHHQKIMVRKGDNEGVSANFLRLAIDPSIEADYFAFSDQDDIWHKDKLQRALAWFASVPAEVPCMYCGRTELMADNGRTYGLSPLFTRPPGFQNALVQSLGGGNTMVFNRPAKKLLQEAATIDVVLHDWWLYQLVSGAGGIVHYDPEPVLKYRQHPHNVIGSNLGWWSGLIRVRMILNGRFRRWNDTNIAALQHLPPHLLGPKNKDVLTLLAKARRAPMLKRLIYLRRSGVYRQTLLGDIGLFVAATINRI
jgi:glycosyltransferase involved in cell wall biosynthesis